MLHKTLFAFSLVLIFQLQTQAQESVLPIGFSVTAGQQAAGKLGDLGTSDNLNLTIRRTATQLSPILEIEIDAISPTVPTTFSILVEAAVFSRRSATQTIELFDFELATWEQVDTRLASRFSDATVEVTLDGDLYRFVETGTGRTRARLRFAGTRTKQSFAANIDQINWQVTNMAATDADGNVYDTIRMGDQIWMLENLKTTSMNDGTPIEEHAFDDDWNEGNFTIPKYQWADTSDLNNLYDYDLPFDFFGAMYNEATLASGTLAPAGWRIPSQQDFVALRSFLASDGQAGIEGTVLKSTTGWVFDNGTDVYGFNGLPNGYVHTFGGATGAQAVATWATTNTDSLDSRRTVLNLVVGNPEFAFNPNSQLMGSGVRCIKN